MLATKFARNNARIHAMGAGFLTEDQLRSSCPSIFAAEAHDSRSARYAYIPTIDVVRGLAGEGFKPTFACQAVPRKADKFDFTKHMIRFRRESDIGKTEAAETIMINSHDGTSSYQLLGGVFRFVCSNGLVTGDKFDEVRVSHKGNIVDEVIQGAFRVVDTFEQISTATERMKSIDLKPAEAYAFAESAAMIRFDLKDGDRSPVKPQAFLVPRRAEDRDDASLWNAFNRIQENAIRGGLHGRTVTADNRTRRVTTREMTGIDGATSLNRALWNLAERMAEIKGAN